MTDILRDFDVRPLAAGVITQALRDYQGRHPLKAIDAAMWLSGPDFPLWAEALDMPFADGLALLTRWRGAKRLGKKG